MDRRIAFCAVFFYPIGWLTGRGRYEGWEHIPATGGALIEANHISHLDPIFSGQIVERSGRVPRFLENAVYLPGIELPV